MSTAILNQEKLETTLEKYGLNYHVDTYREKNPFTNEYLDSYGTYRTNDLKVLKTGFSARYLPIQNIDAFSVISSIQEIKDDVSIKSMGHLNGKPFAKLNFGTMDIDSRKNAKKGDVVNKYVYFINSFDGTSSLKFQVFLERLVCLNGMTSNAQTDSWSFSHTINASKKVTGLVDTLKIIDGVFIQTEANYNALASKSIDSKMVDDVLNELFPLDESKKRLNTISTKTQDIIKEYYNDCDNGFIPKGTAWALYNGITRYLTHDRANKKGEVKEHSLVVGSIHKTMKESLTLINEMVGV
jgi:hypothetical protein